ncbi:MAG: hypothetical protein MJE77_37895 [Proteobacteria bacterium]|nr:hypothetical protein [Pseudomonadota bacterium]
MVLCLSGCWDGLPDVDKGPVDGYIGAAQPIAGAFIDIYQLDDRTGELVDRYPIASTPTPSNANGEFRIPDMALSGTLLFVARGGEVKEYWSPTPARLHISHLTAVVEYWIGTRPVTITPWTTLSHELAAARYRSGEAETFGAAVRDAERLLYRHFIGNAIGAHSENHCPSHLNCLRPSARLFEPEDRLPESDTYALTLIALSARVATETAQDIENLNSVTITTGRLVPDARDARFDGISPEGSSETTRDTLRSELGRAFAIHGLGAVPESHSYVDFAVTFERLASNTDSRLFGEGEPEPIDAAAPSIYVGHSPIFDERDSRIVFDENRIPIHFNDKSSVISLETVFEPGCPEIHKHVNLLDGTNPAANPLQWRFTVYDEGTGLVGVRAEVSIGPSFHPMRYANVLVANEQLPDGGYDVLVTATSDSIPELSDREAKVRISVVAVDGVGNESTPLNGCWHHVPRAAPLWVGPVTPADGPESLLNYSLERDNLSPVLNGLHSPSNAPILASFEIFNPNDQLVYLTMRPQNIHGEFAWTWNYEYDFNRLDLGVDSCIQQVTCTPVRPIRINRPTSRPNPPIPVDGVLLTADGFCSGDCSGTSIPVAPGAPITVHVRWSNFGIMAPEGTSPGEFSEFADPVDGQGLATGTSRAYVYCVQDNGDGTCTDREFYQEHITMRAALLAVQGAITGKTSTDAFLTPRTPIGQERSFGIAHGFSQRWISSED